MTQVETALLSIIGKYPTYMRPPYFATNDFVLSTLGGLGYKVIQADIDTKDYLYPSPDTIGTAIGNLQAGLNAGGTITLMHDPLINTVQSLLPAAIQEIQSRGLRGKFFVLSCKLQK
jgi:peptidoglycan/xylan/chitin deacetylase (PgdA/CDA1 family)